MSRMMQFRAWLVDSEPEVWRRLILDPRLTLQQLHTALQHAFGWTNSHLHQFHAKDGTRYATPTPRHMNLGFGDPDAIDDRKILLGDVFNDRNKLMGYEYDFGDSWMHDVRFEKLVESETVEYAGQTFIVAGKGKFSGKVRAAICLAGERSGPPEDCGGLSGYQRILELKAKPPHPTAKNAAGDRELMEWLGDFDSDYFDLAEVNQMLGKMRVKKAHLG